MARTTKRHLPDVLTSAQAAESLGVTKATLLRWVQRGHISATRAGGTGAALFDRREVERVRQTGGPRSRKRKHRPCQCVDCLGHERVSA